MMYTFRYVHIVVVCEEMALLREELYAHVTDIHSAIKFIMNYALGLMKENCKR